MAEADSARVAARGAAPLLEMRGISKSFPGVDALRGVDLTLGAGEVLALLGENGAGKSTLIKVLGGAHRPDSGTIRIDGRPVEIASPTEGLRAGIGVIYQEFNLIPALSAWENIVLGRERTTAGVIHRRAERRRALAVLERMGIRIDPDAPCGRLSVAEQQSVEIAKALSQNARILVMDEPSATLSPREVESLFNVIRDLRRQGVGVIYISHRLEEIFVIADRITVLRDGAHVGDRAAREIDRSGLIELLVGRALEKEFPARKATIGEPRLVVEDLHRGTAVQGVSFEARRGEILVLTGLVGAGRTETARLIFGADRRDGGTITLDGKRLSIRSPRDAIRAGICLLTEDRKSQGLVLKRSVLENFGLPNLRRFACGGVIRGRAERAAFDRFAARLGIKVPHHGQLARNLSGGNQQKLVLAKWLERNAEVVLFDEPTRGIDVGAKYEIYSLMNRLAEAGKTIVVISSELPEVIGMADRILVLHGGRVTGELTDVANTTQEEIMDLAIR